jgi:hypothetical protein
MLLLTVEMVVQAVAVAVKEIQQAAQVATVAF